MNFVFITLFILLALLVFWLTKKSIERLGTKILPFYPFGLILPKSNAWSIIYLIIIIILLAALAATVLL